MYRFVFLKPPSLDVLEARLRERGTETEESLNQAGHSPFYHQFGLLLYLATWSLITL